MKITNVDTQRQPEPRDQRLRLLRGAAAQSRHLRSHASQMTATKPRRAADIVLGVGQQLTVPVHAGGRRRSAKRSSSAAETPLLDTTSLSSGAQLRQPPGREPADVLEHADHAVALRAGHERQRCADAGVAGLRGQHVAVGRLAARPAAGRHAEPADAAGRRQQLHARRRQQQRQQPAHRRVAQLRHDPGDARRVVELRRLGRARPRPADLDDDARRHEHSSAAPSTTSTGRTS